MILEEVRLAILIVGAAISTYTDLKKGLIYDKVTYPMIALGMIFTLADIFLTKNILQLAIPLFIFLFTYALYFAGKLGGGDVKFLVAMALLLPFYKEQPFMLSALLIAALSSAFIVSLIMLVRFFRSRKRPKIKIDAEMIKTIALGIVIIAYLVAFSFFGNLNFLAMLVISIPLIFSIAFLALRAEIQESFFLRWVSIDSLEEDEIVAKEYLEKDLVEKLGLSFKGIITEKDKEKLKKAGVVKVPVYRNLPPFAPFLLFGIVVAAIIPDIFIRLFIS